MDLDYKAIDIKQEDDDGMDIKALQKVDYSYSCISNESDWDSIKVEEMKIEKCDEYDSTISTFEYINDNKAAVKNEIENMKADSVLDMDPLHDTVDFGIRPDSDQNSSTELVTHIMQYPEIRCSHKLSLCIHCDKSFKSKQALDDHVIKKHVEFIGSVSSKVHQCEHCSYKTTNSCLLASHIEKHPESGYSVKQVLCIHCDKVFKSKKALDDHIIKKHEDFIASVSSKTHKCDHCTYKTTHPFLFANHMVKHPESGSSLKLSPCIHCDKKFQSKQALDDHIIKNHIDFIGSVLSKIHQCEHCSYKTTYLRLLTRHMMKHHESGSSVKPEIRSCLYCDKSFKSKRALDDHIIKNHKHFIASVLSKIHQCKHCNYKTTYSSLLIRHMGKHPEGKYSVKQYPCINCDKTFKSKRVLDDHVIKNHEELTASVSYTIHQCKHCSYKTTNSSVLAIHVGTHFETGSSLKQRPCNHCNATFKTKRALDDHVIKNHEEFIESVTSKIHQCKHCSYKTTDSSLLAGHMNKHPDSGCIVKQYPCIHCDKKFKSQMVLDNHVIKNHEEFIASVSSKVHECEHCIYKTTSSTLFVNHMGKHPETKSSVKQRPCIHCNAKFKSKRALDEHVIRRHTDFIASVSSKIHQCKHCSYKTTNSVLLTSHMEKHPESGMSVKQYLCTHCDKSFKSKKALDDHIIKKHTDFIASVSSKIHQCKHCSYKTTDSSLLDRHSKKHPEHGS